MYVKVPGRGALNTMLGIRHPVMHDLEALKCAGPSNTTVVFVAFQAGQFCKIHDEVRHEILNISRTP